MQKLLLKTICQRTPRVPNGLYICTVSNRKEQAREQEKERIKERNKERVKVRVRKREKKSRIKGERAKKIHT